MQEDSTTHYPCLSYHLSECLMACTSWICSQTTLPWAKHGSKWGGQRSHACSSAFALTVQQLLVAYGLHAMQQSHVARPHSPCSMLWLMEPLTIVSDSDRSARVMSADFCKNIHLSEVSLILRLLHSFLDFNTKCTPPLAAALHYKSWLICTWPLTSPLSAVFAYGLKIQEAHAIRHSNRWWDKHEWCYHVKNGHSPWSSPWSSP